MTTPIDPTKYDGHTKGPWVLGQHIANPKMNIVNPVMFGNRMGKLPEWEGGHTYCRHKPDARLIADAPLLLARVKELEAENARMRKAMRLIWDVVSGANEGVSVGSGGTFTNMGDAMTGIEMRDRVKDSIKEILGELDEDNTDA